MVLNMSELFLHVRPPNEKNHSILRGGHKMKKEYNFTKAEQGKFYSPIKDLEIPIYLNKNVQNFFAKQAPKKNMTTLVNTILLKEIEVLKKLQA